MKFFHVYIIHALFEIVRLEIFTFLCLISCLFDKMLIDVNLSTTISTCRSKSYIIAVERLITCYEWVLLASTSRTIIELIGRCLLVQVRIGFFVACPKRAQKLLVGQSQTLLIYFIFVLIIFLFVVLVSRINNFIFTFLLLFLCNFSCLCGFSSTDLSLHLFL